MPLEFASRRFSGRVLTLVTVARASSNQCPGFPNTAPPLFQVWWVSLADLRPHGQKPPPRCGWSAAVSRGGCLPLPTIVYGPTVCWTFQVRKENPWKILGWKTDHNVFSPIFSCMPYDRSSVHNGELVAYFAVWPLCWNMAQVSVTSFPF